QLLWPFSSVRIAWNVVSVFDPLFTVPVLALVMLATRSARPRYAYAALCWAVAYLAFGCLQMTRVEAEGLAYAAEREHALVRLEAKPSLGNLRLWQVIYEHNGRYYVDEVRAGTRPIVIDGDSIEKLDLEKHFPSLDRDS